jgi:NAD(P)-dependent dehydrogenase (short-subunit alcohol dehydrogenase family)
MFDPAATWLRGSRMPSVRSVIVTGAASGIGAACVERLHRDGWSVALVDVASGLAQSVARFRDRVLAFQGDVVDEAFCERVVVETATQLGPLGGLIHAAGISGQQAPVIELPLHEIRRVLETNLIGSFVMASSAARHMSRAGSGGAIVLIGSTGGRRGEARDAPYATSKAGVHILAQVMASELGGAGIRVNALAPGPILTRMHTDYVELLARETATTPEEQLEEIRRTIPIARHGRPSDVAAAAAWLLSDDAGFITGQTIGVDGGVLPWS